MVLLVKLFSSLNFCSSAAKEKLGHGADGLDHLQKEITEVLTLPFTFISIRSQSLQDQHCACNCSDSVLLDALQYDSLDRE